MESLVNTILRKTPLEETDHTPTTEGYANAIKETAGRFPGHLLGGMMAETKIEWVIGPDGKRRH